jgi:hypothetical protein
VVDTYEPGDKLYFFGFSRGAYTARSAVGLVRNCGILRRPVQVRGHSGLDLHSGRPNADPPLTGQDRRDVDHADHPSASSKPAAPHHQEPRRSWAGTRTKGLNGPKVAGRRFNDEPLRSHKPRWELRSRFHQIVLIRRETSHSDRHARSLLKMKTWVNSLPHHGRPVICVTSERPATLQPPMLGFTPDPAAAAGVATEGAWIRRPTPSSRNWG